MAAVDYMGLWVLVALLGAAWLDFQGVSVDREEWMRFALGFLIGACLWAAGNRAHATTIPATPSTQTQPATYATQAPTQKWYMPTMGSHRAQIRPHRAAAAWHVRATELHDLLGCTAHGWKQLGACGDHWAPKPVGGCAGLYRRRTADAADCQLPGGLAALGTRCKAGSASRRASLCPSGWTLLGLELHADDLHAARAATRSAGLAATRIRTRPARRSVAVHPGDGFAGQRGLLQRHPLRLPEREQSVRDRRRTAMVRADRSPRAQACTGSTPQGATASPTSCPAGQVPGTINGQTVCLGAGDSNPVEKVETTTTTTTNAQGQPTGTTTTTTTTKGHRDLAHGNDDDQKSGRHDDNENRERRSGHEQAGRATVLRAEPGHVDLQEIDLGRDLRRVRLRR